MVEQESYFNRSLYKIQQSEQIVRAMATTIQYQSKVVWKQATKHKKPEHGKFNICSLKFHTDYDFVFRKQCGIRDKCNSKQ